MARGNRPGRAALVFWGLVFLWQVTMAKPTPKLEPKTPAPTAPHADSHVIVRYATGAAAHAATRAAGTRATAGPAGLVIQSVNANETVQDAIQRLQQRSDVLYAEPDYVVTAASVLPTVIKPNDKLYGSQWGLPAIGAPGAWAIATGSSSDLGTVCIVDTGVDYTHVDLAANMAGPGYNVITNTFDAMDDNGHGTRVAGIVGAVGNNSIGVAGVTWAAQLLPCKFLDNTGAGYISDAITCWYWCQAENATISSNSWGFNGYSQAGSDAMLDLGSQGHLFVVASGNGGVNNDLGFAGSSSSYPAAYITSYQVNVAAMQPDGSLPSWSNYGPASTHIAAPGTNIISTAPNGSYNYQSGTSEAAPFVTGALALMGAASNFALTNLQLRSILLGSARKVWTQKLLIADGNHLNLTTAVKAAQAALTAPSPPPSPPPPAAVLSGKTLTVPRLPFASQNFVLGAAPLAPIPDEWATLCGGVQDEFTNFYPRLASPSFRKVVANVVMPAVPTSGSFSVDTCAQASSIDTIMSVLACDSGTSGCTCYSNDDGCASGYPWGSSVTVPWTEGTTYYAIVYAYTATNPQPGSFTFTINDADSPRLPSVSLTVPSVPFFSHYLDIVDGANWLFDNRLTSLCDFTMAYRMESTAYRKEVFRLTHLQPNATSFEIDTCTQPGGMWDSVLAVLACTAVPNIPDGVTDCTCYVDDDGCGFPGGPSKLTAVPYAAGQAYYAITTTYLIQYLAEYRMAINAA